MALSIIDLLKDTWSLTTERKRWLDRFLPFMIIYGFGNFMLIVYLLLFMVGKSYDHGLAGEILKHLGLPVELTAGVLLFFLLALFLVPALFVVPIGVLASFQAPQKASLDTIAKEGFRLLLPFLQVFVAYVAIVLVGLVFFVIPGIYFGIRYSLALPAFVIENKRGFSALSRSRELTESRFTDVVLMYFVFLCLFLLFKYGVTIIAGIDLGPFTLVLGLFIFSFFFVFSLAYQFTMYKRLAALLHQ